MAGSVYKNHFVIWNWKFTKITQIFCKYLNNQMIKNYTNTTNIVKYIIT